MRFSEFFRWAVTAFVIVALAGFVGWTAAEEQTAAQAGEKIGVEGTFVRVATNDEGWVVVGYRTANESVGNDLMLIEIGITVMKGAEDQKITRDAIKLVTPNHEVISLPTQKDFAKVRGRLTPLLQREAMMSDSINYWPAGVNKPCHLAFFALPGVTMVRDEIELTSDRACTGRIFFEVPGGIQLGNYNLDVVFKGSVVRVPMEIMTKEKAKEFEKEWKEARKKAKH